jgi:predicted transcriptional regulator YdeE
MAVSLVELGRIELVGIKVVGRRSELSHRVPMAWLELLRLVDAIPHRVDPAVFYGAFPEVDPERAGDDPVYTYWVGTEVREVQTPPDGTAVLTIPAGAYAMDTVRGGAEEIDVVYRRVGGWIDACGRAAAAGAYGLERYDTARQPVAPPYERFDYDVFRPLG